MNTIDVRYKATPAWNTHRAVRVEKCTQCGTCYPDRYLEAAALHDGVCGACREGCHD